MAKAIKQIEKNELNAVEEQAQDIKELVEMTAESREALLIFLEILQELHQVGILEMMKGALKTRNELGVLAMDQVNSPQMHNMIKNGISAVGFISALDADQMKTMLNGVNRGLESSAEGTMKKEVSLWGLSKSMRDPNVKRSLSAMMSFLEGMGKELGKKPS